MALRSAEVWSGSYPSHGGCILLSPNHTIVIYPNILCNNKMMALQMKTRRKLILD